MVLAAPCERQCGNGQCYSRAERCDGYFDCNDEADEEGCPPGEVLPSAWLPGPLAALIALHACIVSSCCDTNINLISKKQCKNNAIDCYFLPEFLIVPDTAVLLNSQHQTITCFLIPDKYDVEWFSLDASDASETLIWSSSQGFAKTGSVS